MLKGIVGFAAIIAAFVVPMALFPSAGYSDDFGVGVNFTETNGTTIVNLPFETTTQDVASFDFTKYYWQKENGELVAGSLDMIPEGVTPTISVDGASDFTWQVKMKVNESEELGFATAFIYRNGTITTVPEDGSWVTICNGCSGGLSAYAVYKFEETANKFVEVRMEGN
jgi:hypothetical protein